MLHKKAGCVEHGPAASNDLLCFQLKGKSRRFPVRFQANRKAPFSKRGTTQQGNMMNALAKDAQCQNSTWLNIPLETQQIIGGCRTVCLFVKHPLW